MILTSAAYDALFYAIDGQLFWVESEGEYRNRNAVVFDTESVRRLVGAGFLVRSSVVCSISTAPGWVGAVKLEPTEAGRALFAAQQPVVQLAAYVAEALASPSADARVVLQVVSQSLTELSAPGGTR